jgi:hypothetical protein
MHDIRLSGGEITFLKALGLSGTPMNGRLLLTRLGEIDENELVDTIETLMKEEYVMSSKVNIMNKLDVEHSIFRVNSIYADDLRDALRPGKRRDETERRRRRS